MTDLAHDPARTDEPPPREPPPATNGRTPEPDPLSRLMAELDARAVNGNEVGNQPPAVVIVPELGITGKSTVEIFGRMKSGKTFFTLDLACSLASGTPWRGHDLAARPVLYLIGEGTPGLGSRVRAWKHHRGVHDLAGLTFQPTRLTLSRDDDFRALLAWVKTRGPYGLVVVDTLARYSVGANENSSEMRTIVDRAETIRDECSADAPLIVVHHSGHGNSDRGRGDSGIEAACDLIVRTTKDGDKHAAEVLEDRHAPSGRTLRFRLDAVPEARETGEDDDPAVVVPDMDTTSDFLPDSRRHVLDALASIQIGANWVSAGAWLDASGMPATTFYRCRKDLVVRQWVEVDETGRHPRYRVAPDTPSEQGF